MLLGSLLLVNEEALSLIASGDPDLAVKRFRQALSMLRSVASHFQEPLLSGVMLGHAVPQALPAASCDSWHSEPLGFYPKAFQVHGIPASSLQVPVDKIGDQEVVILSRLITPVLLYNFALALQLSANSEAKKASLFLKACKLYFLCLQSLREDQVDGNAQILRLAASTNMGSIHSFFYQPDQSQACYYVLRSSFDDSMDLPDEEREDFQKLFLQTKLYSWKNAPAA